MLILEFNDTIIVHQVLFLLLKKNSVEAFQFNFQDSFPHNILIYKLSLKLSITGLKLQILLNSTLYQTHIGLKTRKLF